MKQYLWIIGLVLVVIAGFGYAYSASSEKPMAWIVSTIAVVIGGVFLLAAFFSYHKLLGKKS